MTWWIRLLEECRTLWGEPRVFFVCCAWLQWPHACHLTELYVGIMHCRVVVRVLVLSCAFSLVTTASSCSIILFMLLFSLSVRYYVLWCLSYLLINLSTLLLHVIMMLSVVSVPAAAALHKFCQHHVCCLWLFRSVTPFYFSLCGFLSGDHAVWWYGRTKNIHVSLLLSSSSVHSEGTVVALCIALPRVTSALVRSRSAVALVLTCHTPCPSTTLN